MPATERAIVIFPDTPALAQIESLRRCFDPLAPVIPAHLTLVFPFADDIATDALRAHMRRAVAGLDPFRLRLTGISVAEDEYLFLDVATGRDQVIALHDRLYAGPLAAHRVHDRVYRPHVTLGRLSDRESLTHAASLAVSAGLDARATVSGISVFQINSPEEGAILCSVGLVAGD